MPGASGTVLVLIGVEERRLLTTILSLTAFHQVAASVLFSRPLTVLTLGVWGWICTGALSNLFPSTTRLVTLGPVSPFTPISVARRTGL